MKVKIQQRSVYHKFTEIEIEVPKDVDVQEWLIDNEYLWSEDMDEKHATSKYEFGMGMETGEWNEIKSESEWRFEAEGGYGGHL
jgi:hypothetical protein